MDPAEQLLATNEEELSAGDLEKIVHLLKDEVQRHREELSKQQAELQELRTQETKRTRSREQHAAILVQILDLQEALEEREKTQQQLREVSREMERLSDPATPETSEVLESRFKEMEDIIAAYQEKEKKLKEESQHLKRLLEQSEEELAQVASEHQRVTEELHTAQTAHPDHGGPGPSEMELLLESCMKEIRLRKVLPNKNQCKK